MRAGYYDESCPLFHPPVFLYKLLSKEKGNKVQTDWRGEQLTKYSTLQSGK